MIDLYKWLLCMMQLFNKVFIMTADFKRNLYANDAPEIQIFYAQHISLSKVMQIKVCRSIVEKFL